MSKNFHMADIHLIKKNLETQNMDVIIVESKNYSKN
jgi:hypothetical protein